MDSYSVVVAYRKGLKRTWHIIHMLACAFDDDRASARVLKAFGLLDPMAIEARVLSCVRVRSKNEF